MRILLAVGVFLAHADRDRRLPEQFGDACVQVFFSLSGFLIGAILLETPLAKLPKFYFKRVTRIWLPYGIALALLMVVSALKQDLGDPILRRVAFNYATFVINLFEPPDALYYRAPMYGAGGHLWSICVEEQFYLLAPLILILGARWRAPIMGAVCVLGLFVPHQFSAISLGVLLAVLTRQRDLKRWERLSCVPVFALILIGLANQWLAYETAGPVAAVLVVAAASKRGAQTRAGTLLGGMSYPLYLNHWLPLFFRPRLEHILGIGPTLSALLALCIVLSGAAFHFVVIEQPVLANRERWFTKRRGALAWALSLGTLAIGVLTGLLSPGWGQ